MRKFIILSMIFLSCFAHRSDAISWGSAATTNTPGTYVVYPGLDDAADISVINDNFYYMLRRLDAIYTNAGTPLATEIYLWTNDIQAVDDIIGVSSATSYITNFTYYGNGAGLTNVSGSVIVTGIVDEAYIDTDIARYTQVLTNGTIVSNALISYANSVSNWVTALYEARDTVVSNGLVSYVNSVSNWITLLYTAADTSATNAVVTWVLAQNYHAALDLTGTLDQAVSLTITEIGTITTGTWTASVIDETYLDADMVEADESNIYSAGTTQDMDYAVITNLTATKAYRGSTDALFTSDEYITEDHLNNTIELLSGETLFGATNAHPVLTTDASLLLALPGLWTNVTALGTSATSAGVWAYTNAVQNYIPRGTYVGHFHGYYTGVGGPTCTAYFELVDVSATATNVIATSETVTLPTSIRDFNLHCHMPTNYASTNFLGVRMYGTRAGGVSANMYILGGTATYDTWLGTPNLDVQGYLQNVVEDLTPTLGGNLDGNGKTASNIVWGADVTFNAASLTGSMATAVSDTIDRLGTQVEFILFQTGKGMGIDTVDGSDTGSVSVASGSASGNSRGAFLGLFGNEHPTAGGVGQIGLGSASGSYFRFNGGATGMWQIDWNGEVNGGGNTWSNFVFGADVTVPDANIASTIARDSELTAGTNAVALYAEGLVQGSTNGLLDAAKTYSVNIDNHTNAVQALGEIPSAYTWTVTNRFATCSITGDVALTISGIKEGLSALEVYCNGATGITAAAGSFYSNSDRWYLLDDATNVIQFLTFGGRTYATVENFDN